MKTTLQIIQDRADILESSDGLDRAIALHYAMLMKVYATNPSYFKTLFKSNRFILGLALFSFYATDEDATINQVKEYCEKLNILSKNTIASFFIFLKITRRIETKKSISDKRKVNYTPTRKLIEEVQLLVRTMIIPLKEIFDDYDLEEHFSSDSFFTDFFVNYSDVVFSNIFMHIILPESDCLIIKDAGHVILNNILVEHIRIKNKTISYNVDKAAKECGVSRSHLRRTLLDAQSEGLLTLRSTEGKLTLHDSFLVMAKRYMSIYFAAIEYGVVGKSTEDLSTC